MDWKRYLVAANYYGTLPLRAGANRLAGRRGRMPVMILFYHRVADSHPNAWTISRRLFARQVDWLQARFDLITLAMAQARIREGYNPRPAVCITFDDGYGENCDFAIPLLVGQKIPCTYFVATDHVLHGRPFPHDVASGQPLPPNSLDQLRAMVAEGIEIGCHTRTHADLAFVDDPAILRDEIVTSGAELANLLACPIRYFAFPYGQTQHLTPQSMQTAQQAGYRAVCSAYGGYNFPGGEVFHLRRIHADPDMIRFRNWLTLDRVKLLRRATRVGSRPARSPEIPEVDHGSIG
jgi:peptidoglycan/xylan/chitin deacetylase (PgdA/CDA1 family)